MKSTFKSFRGPLNMKFLILSAALLFSSISHAIFIRGNGGIGVYSQGQWLAYDVFELTSQNPELIFNYSSSEGVAYKVLDYVRRLPLAPAEITKAEAIAMANFFKIDSCNFDELNQPQMHYTYTQIWEQLREQSLLTALMAVNFYDPSTQAYHICTMPMYFDFMGEQQQAVLLFHEVVYVYLEQSRMLPPKPEEVRALVARTLMKF
ncbi:hypothetical protein [Bdellovibrio sp. NC01]|uniref:hypothetical protein n=1 Tax=Bdellovibrio sp. NC01 TaxID=2220073 RepID=UPI0011596222|nr:hypothetical protein [Bdellovibrio sp. NC01]QDK38485.1 hypothetical protein DOE51_13305 [Bdellovibrio sp. NC01]